MTIRSLARRGLVITLAGMVVFGAGEGVQSIRAPGESLGGFPVAAEVAGALLSPASADAAVTKKATAKKSPRRKVAPSMSKGKQKVKLAAGKVKTKGKKSKSAVVRASSQVHSTGGRCEPQSLTYARKRSGIMRSRTGPENGPLTWFASERMLGKTSSVPLPGSVLILGSDRGHGMGTGHVAYVEEAYANGPSSYRVIFSHTNYDRRCSLETNIEASYDSSKMTLDIFSGAWQPWGKGLKVAGFIEE